MADEAANQRSDPSSRRNSTSSALNTQSSSAHFGSSSQMSDPARRRALVTMQTEGYGSINTNPRPHAESSKPKKPPTPRRATSTHLPHKGQEFSVDDAEDEVEIEELKRQTDRNGKLARMASGSVRQHSTVRRRTTAQVVPTLPKLESQSSEDGAEYEPRPLLDVPTTESPEESAELEGESGEPPNEDDGDVSDAESFTLKDRQDAINVTHPFGIRLWKPALYKKNRSVEKTAEGDIHSTPGGHVNSWLYLANILWTLVFGWWLALITLTGAFVCSLFGFFSESAIAYGVVLLGLSKYLLYPFGKYIKLIQDEAYVEEDEGEGRSISEYEQWQSGDLEEGRLFFGPVTLNRTLIGRRRPSTDSTAETQSLLGRNARDVQRAATAPKRRLFGRGKWNLGRVIFFVFFYGLILPLLSLVSLICWLLVFTIPMGKVTWLLIDHLRRHPLALSFHSEKHDTRHPGEPPSSILICTYRAVGLSYWKYTIDGTNIFLINLLALVAFTIFDFYVLYETLELHSFVTSQGFIFSLALLSIIPLAYFIGQAVASISAQSSMGVGATINAFFSTVVEVFLYCVALKQGKAQLVEGSIIGSIFAGILFLPGISMCFGALKRKTQRFNVKSAGVTSTMLLFAMICAFSPTLFYQIYGSHELKCMECSGPEVGSTDRDCRRCYFSQVPAVHDRFYQEAVLPYSWLAAALLFLSYLIGLMFTLRTHAAVIWSTELDEKKQADAMAASQMTARSEVPMSPVQVAHHRGPTGARVGHDARDSQLYSRILGQTLKNGPMSELSAGKQAENHVNNVGLRSPHIVPPKSRDGDVPGFHLQGLSEEDNQMLAREVAEAAATAVVAGREAARPPKRNHIVIPRPPNAHTAPDGDNATITGTEAGHTGGGHDAPNWSRSKSSVVLLTATLAYAIIAEILVNTVDSVLTNIDIDEKFLGITLFALVPNTTEFLNAISFAMNGNIALSMEIGSAYALQVCLLQIPALVAYSAFYGRSLDASQLLDHTFTLIFPQWDMATVILCIFLLSYMYGEGKSNYFKGSILILSYVVIVVGYYFAGFVSDDGGMGVNRADTLVLGRSPVMMGMRSSI
ncbi:hypothetical protein EJ06DRAFT_560055 [Trichodelitschia bisporula]|uniref:Calcium permease family membrane transporter n=1 Tax=Trichodelitschia bisporula TaxID=703511 RepID=A0A6G1HJZ8_9PEZI|nr:hypothetical protein EJ06DRAFT_560055 [Trichodelitschia bisporula]